VAAPDRSRALHIEARTWFMRRRARSMSVHRFLPKSSGKPPLGSMKVFCLRIDFTEIRWKGARAEAF